MVGSTSMAMNALKCNHLVSLDLKGLSASNVHSRMGQKATECSNNYRKYINNTDETIELQN